ncbi:sigma-54-dependent transcriptional regulator [Mucilaginibacter sp. X4EP1]|uniref:sigma-54-dependent transcriptional regulator n=1 Tax=Mucilaginibacter sp. X4EP1 TaxID=2723092 RepID=UPI0021692307|nr:sigma-54 dependent transcriptional regulator [Mucilaginibacter sp. X4EP1]MCS3813431.1 DNA-binding NtrC family response regulator [Mucilaginibacter sp. X4EP1]
MKAKILIVEDQFVEANFLQLILKKAGYKVCTIARSVPEALAIIEKETPLLVLLDIHLNGPLTGIDLAKILRDKNIGFVYLSANSDQQILKAAGATRPYGFLVKPFREKEVLVMIDVACSSQQQNQELIDKVESSDKNQPSDNALDFLIGESSNFLEVIRHVKVVAPSETTVLILGESGTGKELIAKAIHKLSPRDQQPLTVVNCGALPAGLIESELFGHEKGAFTGASEKHIGKFEQADGGTVFLDEVGELPLDLQVKFLRVLQEQEIEPIGGKKKKINVRIIAATNRNLDEEMSLGRFRIDLYYRLSVFPMLLPPLRDRKTDILPIAHYFLFRNPQRQVKGINGFSDAAAQAMLAYHWPGNIRELENLVERAVLLSNGKIISDILPAAYAGKRNSIADIVPLKTIDENERDHIIKVLQACNWKVFGEGGAAEILNINGSTLTSRMKKLGIEKKIILK